jgi:hypothetical protein
MDFTLKIEDLKQELEKAINIGDTSHINYLQGKIDAFEEAQDLSFKKFLNGLFR